MPPHFRSEPHKIGYLRKAVLGHTLSKTPMSNIVTAQYSFNGFINALREHMQFGGSDTLSIQETYGYSAFQR